MTPQEEWRPVVGYEGIYEVSDMGRVRSLPREVNRGRAGYITMPGRVLKPHVERYARLRLVSTDGRGSTRYVHRLVAEAFHGPCPGGMEVCHENGQHLDNRAENLRYDTRAGNQRDLVKHGRHLYARRTHCGKGHEFTASNTVMRSGRGYTWRECRACEEERGKRRWQDELARRAAS